MAWDLIDLRDPGLFGNEAAEDEPEHIFSSYVLRRPEAARFVNAGNRFCVTRAYKGEGKSALLRLTRLAVQSGPDHSLVVARTSGEIAPALTTSDWPSWTRAWKARIFTHIAREIGGQIGFAWRDDDMSLVEEAEEHGFRRKGLVNSILDRVKVTTPEIAGTKVPSIERRRSGGMRPSKTQHAVARWSKGRAPLWVVVDDVDQNFQNTELQKRRVASFFVACRELINKVPELRIRAAVRPNVWTTLKMEYEALSHVEQYMQDLSWSEDQMRQLLARRIEGYLKRVGRFDQIRNKLPTASEYRDMMLIDLAFEARMSWGGVTRPAHVVLNTLSKHRPRWIVELSQIAPVMPSGVVIPGLAWTMFSLITAILGGGEFRISSRNFAHNVRKSKKSFRPSLVKKNSSRQMSCSRSSRTRFWLGSLLVLSVLSENRGQSISRRFFSRWALFLGGETITAESMSTSAMRNGLRSSARGRI